MLSFYNTYLSYHGWKLFIKIISRRSYHHWGQRQNSLATKSGSLLPSIAGKLVFNIIKLPNKAQTIALMLFGKWPHSMREESADITTFMSFESWIALIKHGLFAVCRLNWSISPCGLSRIVKQLLFRSLQKTISSSLS